jgi:hypothetical protein
VEKVTVARWLVVEYTGTGGRGLLIDPLAVMRFERFFVQRAFRVFGSAWLLRQ